MSKISSFGRPYAMFDVENRDHRKWYAQFVASGTWRDCPVRFLIEEDEGNMIGIMQRKLVQYYADKEFGKTLNK